MTIRERLAAFELDDPSSGLSFTERLARENLWSLRYARRVIVEYKRFLELTIVAEHSCCPSDAVDQAWHQHMVYTRSYWDDLCPNVLQRPLHHGPTRGGQREQKRHHEMYAETLASYERIFGSPAPSDIWPAAEIRFQQSIQSVRVNRGEYWIIPKPNWLQMAGAGGFASLPVFFSALNPLDLPGKTFLAVYAVLVVIALILGLAIMFRAHRSSGIDTERGSSKSIEPDGWAATAMLTDGPRRALLAALTHLRSHNRVSMQGSQVVLEEPSNQWTTSTSTGTQSSEFHQEPLAPHKTISSVQDQQYVKQIIEALSLSSGGLTFAKLLSQTRHAANRLSVHLEDLGLIESPGQRLAKQTMCILPLALVMVLGMGKIFIGMEREKPVVFLVMMVGAAAVFAFLLASNYPRRTPAGNRLINDFRARFKNPDSWMHEPSPTPPTKLNEPSSSGQSETTAASQSAQPDLALLAAIHGMTMMNGLSLGINDPFYQTLGRQIHGANGSSTGGDVGPIDSGCGGDGGGGGCGSGCGGCGGD